MIKIWSCCVDITSDIFGYYVAAKDRHPCGQSYESIHESYFSISIGFEGNIGSSSHIDGLVSFLLIHLRVTSLWNFISRMQLACKCRSIANLLGKREEDKVEEQEDANSDFLPISQVWWRSRWKAIILFIRLSQVDRMMVQLVRKRRWLAQLVFEFQTRQSDLDKDLITALR